MATAAKQWVGQTVDGKFRLGDFVGANERSAVFLTDSQAPGVRKAAIKLVAADSPEAAGLLGRWHHAAELSHPHLIRILAMGRCEFNATAILYVVMEYADENLSVVLARRPLGPAEARAILGPVVDALSYIHSKGFVHTRIKPANIMAEEDLLKISSDGLCRIGESGGSYGQPGAYDPPEAPPQPKQIIPPAQSSFDARRYVVPATIAVLTLAAIILGPRFFRHQSKQTLPPAASVAAEQPAAAETAQPTSPGKPDPKLTPDLIKKPAVSPPGAPVAKPGPRTTPPAVVKPTPQSAPVGTSVKTSNQKKNATYSDPTPAAVHTETRPAAATASGAVHGKVVQQVLPNASQAARDTIRGTVRVSVKVHVDESGRVTEATFDSHGPSQYFADRALQAAPLWKFSPAKLNGQNVPSDWVIRFEIDRSIINVFPVENTP